MVFWTDGYPNSDRTRNAHFTCKRLAELCDYLNNNNINCTYKIYDYSPSQILENSIHIPYPVGVFKKSEKINNILNNTTSDLFSIIDSDCFVAEEDYSKLAEIILNNSTNICITFDVIDFDTEQTNFVVKNNRIDPGFEMSSRFPGRAGTLGAFYITNTDNLKKHGGFSLKFTTWGGEDGEIYDKIYRDGEIIKYQIRRDEIKLYHLNHIVALEDINYFNREEYIKNNF